MMDLTTTGLDEAIALHEALSGRMHAGLRAALSAEAHLIKDRLAAATPRLTGAAATGWEVQDRGVLDGFVAVAITNLVKSPAGFPYPGALLTGTGRRGAGATPAAGYAGSFGGTPGMPPSGPLQAVWNQAATASIAAPVALKLLGP